MQTYKIGDRVVCEESNIDFLFGSHAGLEGTIVDVVGFGYEYPYQIDFGNKLKLWCKVKGYAEEATEATKDTEASKYYNGKVICVAHYYPNSLRIPGFAIGKIYDVVDGRITNDEGWQSTQYESVESLSRGMGNTFLKVVE